MNSKNKSSNIDIKIYDNALHKTASTIDNRQDEILDNDLEDFQGSLKGLLKKSRNKKESASTLNNQSNISPMRPRVSEMQSSKISSPENRDSIGFKNSMLNKTPLKPIGSIFWDFYLTSYKKIMIRLFHIQDLPS